MACWARWRPDGRADDGPGRAATGARPQTGSGDHADLRERVREANAQSEVNLLIKSGGKK
jgi:hypothetical protein